jgi:hypothetical protein
MLLPLAAQIAQCEQAVKREVEASQEIRKLSIPPPKEPKNWQINRSPNNPTPDRRPVPPARAWGFIN